jgi:transcriptional regulator with XRE-family HTH domain
MRARHNLARLRKELHQTQTHLAGILGVSLTTIKSVELGKLALSVSLATKIAAATGADAQWLLDNNLEAPMPPLNFKNQIPVDPEEWLRAKLLESFGYQLEVFLKLNSEAATNIFRAYWSNFENELKKTFGEPGPAKQNYDRLTAQLSVYDPDQWRKDRHEWAMRQHEETLAKLKEGPQGVQSRSPKRRKERSPGPKSS